MNARYLLGIALATAAAVAACSSAPESGSLNPNGADNGASDPSSGASDGKGSTNTPGSATTPGDTSGTGAQPGTLPTASAAGKAFYTANVHPFLESKCSSCHVAGGIGNPTWIVKGDPSKTYDMIYLNAFATAQSRILVKGVHSGGAAPELSAAEKTTFSQWIATEAADGGQKTQSNVLEKFGTCFDQTKFDAIGFGTLKTTRRQNGNNPQNQTENANNCTGCDNAPCRVCHSADDVTGFVMSVGNPLFPATDTFERTKLLSPPFIREYVSTTPAGDPVFNPGIMTKSTNTIEKGLAYSHPMFLVTPTMQTAIQAFVDDAVAKQKAGTCGK